MGSMRILIKGGKVVNDDFTQEADVYIENGIIQQVVDSNTQAHSIFDEDRFRFVIYEYLKCVCVLCNRLGRN